MKGQVGSWRYKSRTLFLEFIGIWVAFKPMSLEEIRYGENITRDDKSLGSSSEEYRNLKIRKKKCGQQRRFRRGK